VKPKDDTNGFRPFVIETVELGFIIKILFFGEGESLGISGAILDEIYSEAASLR
jgi:hypothetical protein